MPWKLDDSNNFVKDDSNNPIWVDENDNSEKGILPDVFFEKISSLNNESKNHRLTAKGLQEKLESFKSNFTIDGKVPEPDEIRKAFDTVKNFKDSDYMTAEKVEQLRAKIKDEISSGYEGKIKEKESAYTQEIENLRTSVTEKQKELDKAELAKGFNASLFNGVIKQKTQLGNFRAVNGYFGEQFKRDENGNMVAYHWDSDRVIISSKTETMGDPAGIEEALNKLYETDPHNAGISKDISGGSGSQGGHGSTPTKGAIPTEKYIEGLGFPS